jgi:hypothetical protein
MCPVAKKNGPTWELSKKSGTINHQHPHADPPFCFEKIACLAVGTTARGLGRWQPQAPQRTQSFYLCF